MSKKKPKLKGEVDKVCNGNVTVSKDANISITVNAKGSTESSQHRKEIQLKLKGEETKCDKMAAAEVKVEERKRPLQK